MINGEYFSDFPALGGARGAADVKLTKTADVIYHKSRGMGICKYGTLSLDCPF